MCCGGQLEELTHYSLSDCILYGLPNTYSSRHPYSEQPSPVVRQSVNQPAGGVEFWIMRNFNLCPPPPPLSSFAGLVGWHPRLMFVRQSNCGAAQQPLFTAPWREASKQKTTDYCDVVSQCMFVRNSHRTDGQVLRCCAACRSSL